MSEQLSQQYTVELFMRAEPQLGSEPVRQTLVDRLVELKQVGAIDEYDVHVWGNAIRPDGPLQGTTYHGHVLEHVDAFREWAATTGASLSGCFDEHELHCTTTGEEYVTVSLPTACLAVYEANELRAVYPHVRGGRQHTVTDALERLGEDVDNTLVAPDA
jgi:hypothetical protein